MLICLFVRQLSDLIEAEPVSKLESLLYRGLLSAHLPQDIKARLLCSLVSPKANQTVPGFGPGKGGSKSENAEKADK